MTLLDRLAKYPVKTIVVDGQVHAYREAGQGQPLILLHGISSGSASWINQLDVLRQSFRVIAWDAPGYGLSEGLNTAQPNAEDYAQRLLGLIDALAIPQAILVGHSLGALQASAFAHLYPERVQTLLIANVAQGYQRSDEESKTQVYQKRPMLLKSLGHVRQYLGQPIISSTSTESKYSLTCRGNWSWFSHGNWRFYCQSR